MSETDSIRSTFRSLRNRNYRLFAAGQVVSNTGTWMQRIAQDWLVLTLTHSGTALGVVTALQFLPILLFSVWGGVLADRFPKRTMLMITQTLMGVLAGILGVLTVTGSITSWQIYVFALLLGTVTAADTPARQSFVVEMVGPEDLQNAVSLNSANFNLGRVLGPAVAGLLIGLFTSQMTGSGWVFLINAVSYAAVVTGLALIRKRDLHGDKRVRRGRGGQREAFAYVRTRTDLMAVLITVAIFGSFGLNFPVLLPLYTTQVFHSGASAYGVISAIMAVGSLLGALLAARRKVARVRLVLGGAMLFGLFELAAAVMPDIASYAAVLALTGVCGLTTATTANAVMQTTVAPELRGRVTGVYVLVFMGGTPIGSPIVGWLAGQIGVRWTQSLCGALTVAAGLGAALWLARRTDRQIQTRLLARPHIAVVARTA
ncbi:MFS transporter [Actinospica durhamensis]|uniref:MFS transporter n=1 Tax=Actinospica durhamensis TaxID=1508375 RepID=A0A941EPB5_9ACTN|nr:MFS transporter [Actinospica durhamensis]MBR7836060.1 MFS transporter [Actinospica durhamensis]